MRTTKRLLLSLCCTCVFSANAKQSAPEPVFVPLDTLVIKKASSPSSGDADNKKQAFESAMVDNAREIGISNGYLATMTSILAAMEKQHQLFDRLLPFTEVIDLASGGSTVDGRYIIPGIVTEIDKSSAVNKVDSQVIIRQEDKTYLLKRQPTPSLRMPTWEDYVYDGGNLEPEKPVAALLPTTNKELAKYNEAIKEGWGMGTEQAIVEINDRLVNAFIDLTGMVRYARLDEEHYISRPTAVVTNVPVELRGNELGLGTKYVSLDGEAEWKTNSSAYSSPMTAKKNEFKKLIYQLIKNGALNMEDNDGNSQD